MNWTVYISIMLKWNGQAWYIPYSVYRPEYRLSICLYVAKNEDAAELWNSVYDLSKFHMFEGIALLQFGDCLAYVSVCACVQRLCLLLRLG